MIKDYTTEGAGTKNYATEQFLDFQMEEGKSVIAQIRDFQKIIHEVQDEGMELSEQFVVGSTIHKLPPSWKDFGITVKHKKNETKFKDLIVRLRIQEHHRERDYKNKDSEYVGKANLTEAKNDQRKQNQNQALKRR